VPSNPTLTSPGRGHKRKRQQEEGAQIEPPVESPQPHVDASISKPQKRKKVQKPVENPTSSSEDEDEEDDDARLEDNYLTRKTSHKPPIDEDASTAHESSGGEDDDDDDMDADPPTHETHSGAAIPKSRTKSRKKTKYVPPDETPAQRDARTIFVGNIPVDVAKSKVRLITVPFLALLTTRAPYPVLPKAAEATLHVRRTWLQN